MTLRKRSQKRLKKRMRSRRKPTRQELIIVRTPYGEARFYKNADGTKSKVKLRSIRPQSPIGIESRPVPFNLTSHDKFNDFEMMDDIPGKKDGQPTTTIDQELDIEDGESRSHTNTTIIESERIKFDNAEHDEDNAD